VKPAGICRIVLSAALGVSLAVFAERTCVEAEHANRFTFPFQIVDADGASGGLALSIPEGIGSEEALPDGQGHGTATFLVPAGRTALRQAWARVFWNGNCSNSLLIRVGDQEAYNIIDNVMRRWHWVPAGRWQLRRGVNDVAVGIREDGVWVDQLAFLSEGERPGAGAIEDTVVPGFGDDAPPWPVVSLSVEYPSSPPLSPTDFKLGHRVDRVIPPVDMATVVIGPGRAAALDVWLRRSTAARQRGTVSLVTREAAVISPQSRQTYLIQDGAPLTRLRFALDAKPAMRRGQSTLHVKVEHDAGVVEAYACRLIRPWEWLVSSSFRMSPRTGIETETSVEERLADGFPGESREVRWQVPGSNAFTPYGLLDMRKAVGEDRSCFAYAYTRVFAPAEGEYLLDVRHDDMIRVWVNGHHALTSLDSAPSSLTRKMAKVRLRTGSNDVLVKICQLKNYWEFGLCFLALDKRSAPVTGESVAELLTPKGTD